MKRILVAAILLSLTGLAHAGLSFTELSLGSPATRTEAFNVADLPFFAVDTTLKLGSLDTNQTGTVYYTFLGQESGYTNSLHLTVGGSQDLLFLKLCGENYENYFRKMAAITICHVVLGIVLSSGTQQRS